MTKALDLGTNDHLSVGQAALRLGVSRHLVLRLSAAGALRAVPMGGRLFYPMKELDALSQHLARVAAAPSHSTRSRRPS